MEKRNLELKISIDFFAQVMFVEKKGLKYALLIKETDGQEEVRPVITIPQYENYVFDILGAKFISCKDACGVKKTVVPAAVTNSDKGAQFTSENREYFLSTEEFLRTYRCIVANPTLD